MSDSTRYHSTVMIPEDQEERLRREKMGASGTGQISNPYARSPTTQTEFQPSPVPTYSPTKSLPRNTYQPQSPSPLPGSSHGAADRPPVSPLTTSYPTEYRPTSRDRVTSNYYDPTSDSGPSESARWPNGRGQSPQVSFSLTPCMQI